MARKVELINNSNVVSLCYFRAIINTMCFPMGSRTWHSLISRVKTCKHLSSFFFFFSFFFYKNNKCLPWLADFKICMNRKLSNIKFGLQQSARLDYKDQQSVDHKLWIINYVNPFALAGFMQRCLVVSILTLHRADHRSITAHF